MNITEQSVEMLKEMQRLYEVEGKSFSQIGAHFGISKQAVHDRFIRNRMKFREPGLRLKVLDRDILVKLYVEEKLKLYEVRRRLKVSEQLLNRELERHGIEKRSNGFYRRKYPELYELETGKTIIVPRPASPQPFRNYYIMANKAGIRISIKSLDKNTFEVTRIE